MRHEARAFSIRGYPVESLGWPTGASRSQISTVAFCDPDIKAVREPRHGKPCASQLHRIQESMPPQHEGC